MKNKTVREVIDFVKGHQLLFDQVIQEDVLEAEELTMEQINLVVGILSKVSAFLNFFRSKFGHVKEAGIWLKVSSAIVCGLSNMV